MSLSPKELPATSGTWRTALLGAGARALGGPIAATLVTSVALVLSACTGASAGSPCQEHRDCADPYQCLNEVCVPRCERNADCGDGFRCQAGLCDAVVSSIGDTCVSEWECGIGQSCVPSDVVPADDSLLAATCQLQLPGASVGSSCQVDEECRNSVCALGRCSQLCAASEECPSGTGCQRIPRLIGNDSALFRGCLQDSGVLATRIPVKSSSERLRIPVPSGAHSFALVAEVDDGIHRVGATRVVSPTGAVLYNGFDSLADLIANPIRHLPALHLSTLFVPNSDSVELETGIYQVDVEASLPPFGAGTAIPRVTAYFKLDHSRKLDLHFYFLDLDDHPCADRFEGGTLNAATAYDARDFQQEYLVELRRILGGGDIDLQNISYKDLNRADLDGVIAGDLPELFAQSTDEGGIPIFFVRSLAPDGVQAQVGGTPGPPGLPGTAASGIAISADTLCYRSWTDLARVTAHSLARQMGLYHNRDPEGTPDPITDTSESTENLMFFGEFGGTTLSPGQKRVLGRYPGLR